MRNLLALLAVVVLAFVGVGYYRDWYKVSAQGDDVHITINREKVTTDVRASEEKVHKALQNTEAEAKK